MANILRNLALLALLTTFATLAATQASGSGHTTRYWDCCKPSCSWPGKAAVSAPVSTCDIHDQPLGDSNAASSCQGGSAHMCSDQSPWAVSNDLAYGFASVNIAGGSESSWCCACYELTFTSAPLAGKKMIVQATNTGGDLGNNQFDIAMPGGGVGLFNACTDQWSAPPSGWGQQYGGISSNTCSSFPGPLQSGCNFRFGWFQGAENPSVDFKQVSCPAALTAKTGCVRNDNGIQYGSNSASPSLDQPTSGSTPNSSPTTSPSAPTSLAPYSVPASSSTTILSFTTVYSTPSSSIPTSSSSESGNESSPSMPTSSSSASGNESTSIPKSAPATGKIGYHGDNNDDELTCEL